MLNSQCDCSNSVVLKELVMARKGYLSNEILSYNDNGLLIYLLMILNY